MGGLNDDLISEIERMGFAHDWAVHALSLNMNNVENAVSYIFEHMDEMDDLISDSKIITEARENIPNSSISCNLPSEIVDIESAPSPLPPLSLPQTLPPLPPLSEVTSVEPPSWKCEACTFMNPPTQKMTCAVCGAGSLPLNDIPNIPSPPVSPITGWKCGACTFTNPESQELVCIVCDAAKGATFSAVQSLGVSIEPEHEIVAREHNVSIEEARNILKERELDDMRLAQSISEPRIDCIACMETVLISEAFTVDCEQAHRFCFDCMRTSAKVALGEKKIATCLMCSHELSQVEIKQLFGEGSSELSTHLDTEIGSVMAAQPDLYIGCPSPDCKEYIEATTPGVPERVTCPRCSYSFCSGCKELFHGVPSVLLGAAEESGRVGGLSCGDAAETIMRWHQWRTQDRDQFIEKVKVEGIEQKKKMDLATKEALSRFAELQQDEAWKEANCRLCPHCGKTVYRVDGCSTMTCGRDASDKGGGNRQDGCGGSFNWRKAAPYVRGGGDKANLPKSIKDVDPDAAGCLTCLSVTRPSRLLDLSHLFVSSGEVLHHLCVPAINGEGSEDLTIPCDVCHKPIVGPRFSCIHCFPGLECCLACSDTHKSTLGASTSSTHDPNTHAFQIFFEDQGKSSLSSESVPPPPTLRASSWYSGIAEFEAARRAAVSGQATGPTSGCSPS